MRTRMKGRCQLKLTTLGAAKVYFLEENGIVRVCEAHFCYSKKNHKDKKTRDIKRKNEKIRNNRKKTKVNAVAKKQ